MVHPVAHGRALRGNGVRDGLEIFPTDDQIDGGLLLLASSNRAWRQDSSDCLGIGFLKT